MNIFTLGDLISITEQEMLNYKNFGETSLKEVREMLTARNLRLGQLREHVRQHDRGDVGRRDRAGACDEAGAAIGSGDVFLTM